MDFGFLRPPFALTVKDARTGGEMVTPEVRGSDTVADLKAKLRASDVIPQDAVKVHVAHGGKLLQDADGLEMLRAVPVVVLAIVRPPPPPTTPTPTEAILEALRLRQPAAPPPQPPQPPPPQPPPPEQQQQQQQQQPFAFNLPSREEIAHAWDRFFPSTDDEPQANTRGDAPPAAAAEPEERLCRVCFCGEEAGPLIAPCRCRGSMRFVHASCLNEWRVASANPNSFQRCDQCGYRYRIKQTRLAALLQSERVILAATVLTLSTIVLLGSLIPGPERWLYRTVRWHPAYELAAWGWGPYCDALVRGLMWPAAGGMALSVRTQYQRHRGLPLEQQYWAAALVVSFADNGAMLLRPLLVGGLGYFSTQLAAATRSECRRLFTRFGERILEMGAEE